MYMPIHEKKPEEAGTRSAALEVQASYRNTKFITVVTWPSHRPWRGPAEHMPLTQNCFKTYFKIIL